MSPSPLFWFVFLFLLFNLSTHLNYSQISSTKFVSAANVSFESLTWYNWNPSAATAVSSSIQEISSSFCDSLPSSPSSSAYPGVNIFLDLSRFTFPSSSSSNIISITQCSSLKKIWIEGTLNEGTSLQITKNSQLEQIVFMGAFNRSKSNQSLEINPNCAIVISQNSFFVSSATRLLEDALASLVAFYFFGFSAAGTSIRINDNNFAGSLKGYRMAIELSQMIVDHPDFILEILRNFIVINPLVNSDVRNIKINGGIIASAKIVNISGNHIECPMTSNNDCYGIHVNQYCWRNIGQIDFSHNFLYSSVRGNAITIYTTLATGPPTTTTELKLPSYSAPTLDDLLLMRQDNISLITMTHNIFENALDVLPNLAGPVSFCWGYISDHGVKMLPGVWSQNVTAAYFDDNVMRGVGHDDSFAFKLDCELRILHWGYVSVQRNRIDIPAFSVAFGVYVQFYHMDVLVYKIEISDNYLNATADVPYTGASGDFGDEDAPYANAVNVHFYIQAHTTDTNEDFPTYPFSAAKTNVYIYNNKYYASANKLEILRVSIWNCTYPIGEVQVYDNSATRSDIRRVDGKFSQLKGAGSSSNTESESTGILVSLDPRIDMDLIVVRNNTYHLNFVFNPNAYSVVNPGVSNGNESDGVYGMRFVLQEPQFLRKLIIENNRIEVSPLRQGIGFQGAFLGMDMVLVSVCASCYMARPGPVGPIEIRNNIIRLSSSTALPLTGCAGIAFRHSFFDRAAMSSVLIEGNTITLDQIGGASNAISLILVLNMNGQNLTTSEPLFGLNEINVLLRGNISAQLTIYGDFVVRNNVMMLTAVERDDHVGCFAVAGEKTDFLGDLIFEGNDITINAVFSGDAAARQTAGMSQPSAFILGFHEVVTAIPCPNTGNLKVGCHFYRYLEHPRHVSIRKIIFSGGNNFKMNGGFPAAISVWVPTTVYAGIDITNSTFNFNLVRGVTSHTLLRRFIFDPATIDGFFGYPITASTTAQAININKISISQNSSYIVTLPSSGMSTLTTSQENLQPTSLNDLCFLCLARDDFNISVFGFQINISGNSRIILNRLIPSSSSPAVPSIIRFFQSRTTKEIQAQEEMTLKANTTYFDDATSASPIMNRFINVNISITNSKLQINSPVAGEATSKYSSLISSLGLTNFGLKLENVSIILGSIVTSDRVSIASIFVPTTNAEIAEQTLNGLSSITTSSPSQKFYDFLENAFMDAVDHSAYIPFTYSKFGFVTRNNPNAPSNSALQAMFISYMDRINSLLSNPFTTSSYFDNVSIATTVPKTENTFSSILQIASKTFNPTSSPSLFPQQLKKSGVPFLFAKCVVWNGRALSKAASRFGFPLPPYQRNSDDSAMGFIEPELQFEKCGRVYSATQSLSPSISQVPQCSPNFIVGSATPTVSVRTFQYYKRFDFSAAIVLEQDQDGSIYSNQNNNNNNKVNIPPNLALPKGRLQSDQFTVFKQQYMKTNSQFSSTSMVDKFQIVSVSTTAPPATSTSFSSNNNNDNNKNSGIATSSIPQDQFPIFLNDSYIISDRAFKLSLLVRDVSALNQNSYLYVTIRINHNLLACDSSSSTSSSSSSSSPSTNRPFVYTDFTISFDRSGGDFISASVIQATSSASRVASVITAATGNPMVASTMARSLLLERYVDCQFDPAEEPLEFELSPLGWSIGREKGKYLRGTLVGNGFLELAMFSVLSFLVVLWLWNRNRKRQAEWKLAHPEGEVYVTFDEYGKRQQQQEEEQGKDSEKNISAANSNQIKNKNKINNINARHTKMKLRGPPSVLTWKKFKTSMYSIGAVSMLFSLNGILVQGSVSASVSLILYGDPNSRYTDRIMGVGAILATFSIGIFMIWTLAVGLPNRPRVRYFYNVDKCRTDGSSHLMSVEVGKDGRGKSLYSGSSRSGKRKNILANNNYHNKDVSSSSDEEPPDEAEIIQFLLYVPSADCVHCAREREIKKRNKILKKKSFRHAMSMNNSVNNNNGSNNHLGSMSKRRSSLAMQQSLRNGEEETKIMTMKEEADIFGKSTTSTNNGIEMSRFATKELIGKTSNLNDSAKNNMDKKDGSASASPPSRRRRSSFFLGASTSTPPTTITRDVQKRRKWWRNFFKKGKQFFQHDGHWKVANSQQYYDFAQTKIDERREEIRNRLVAERNTGNNNTHNNKRRRSFYNNNSNDDNENEQFEQQLLQEEEDRDEELKKLRRQLPTTTLVADKRFFSVAGDVFRDLHPDLHSQWYLTFIYCLQFCLAALQGYAPDANSSSCEGFGTTIAVLNTLPAVWMITGFPFRHWLMNWYSTASSLVIALQGITLMLGYLGSTYNPMWLQMVSAALDMTLKMVDCSMMLMDLIMVFFESPVFVVYILRRLRHVALHRILGNDLIGNAIQTIKFKIWNWRSGSDDRRKISKDMKINHRNNRPVTVNILNQDDEEYDVVDDYVYGDDDEGDDAMIELRDMRKGRKKKRENRNNDDDGEDVAASLLRVHEVGTANLQRSASLGLQGSHNSSSSNCGSGYQKSRMGNPTCWNV